MQTLPASTLFLTQNADKIWKIMPVMCCYLTVINQTLDVVSLRISITFDPLLLGWGLALLFHDLAVTF